MAQPSLSIVIPTHNGRCHLERCLDSVRRCAPRGTQVIVVDDASTDGTAEWLRAAHPWVKLIRLESNVGFCRAVNAGLEAASGKIIELLNNDTEVSHGWADRALRHFADPTVGSVAPLVLWLDQPWIIDSAGQEYHLCGWGRNRGYGKPLSKEFERPAEVFGPSGSSGFYRRSALEMTGGMLPELGAYLEDIDLSFRLRWAGYKCIYEPRCRVYHKGSASYSKLRSRVIQLLARNEELVFWINLPKDQLLRGLLPHTGFLLIRTLRKLWDGHWRGFFAGKLDALRLIPFILKRRRFLRSLERSTETDIDIGATEGKRVVSEGWAWMAHRRSA